MSENKVTVAELLARRRAESGDASTRPRRRRSAEEGGVSVSELTGSIPIVEGAEHHDRHSSTGNVDDQQNFTGNESGAAPATTDGSSDSLIADQESTEAGGTELASSTVETVDGASTDSDATAADNSANDENQLSTDFVDNDIEADTSEADGVENEDSVETEPSATSNHAEVGLASGSEETDDSATSDTDAQSADADGVPDSQLVDADADGQAADSEIIDGETTQAGDITDATIDDEAADESSVDNAFGGSFANGSDDEELHPHTGSDFGALPADMVSAVEGEQSGATSEFSEEASAAIAQTGAGWDTTEHESSLSVFGGHDEHALTADEALAGYTPAELDDSTEFTYSGPDAATAIDTDVDASTEFTHSGLDNGTAIDTTEDEPTESTGANAQAADPSDSADSADSTTTESKGEHVSVPVIILEVIVAMGVGVGIFKGFERLWEGFALPMTALLALAVTLALVGVVHAVVRERDKLMMFFAFIVGVALTCGPYFLVN